MVGVNVRKSFNRHQIDSTPSPVWLPALSFISLPSQEVPKGSLLVYGSHGSAYTNFSVFYDHLLQHIVDQTNLYVRLHLFSRDSYQRNDLPVDELR